MLEQQKSTDTLIKESIRYALDANPLINKSESLIITLYHVLVELYEKDKKYVLLSAPTGTGKSIIGQMISYCSSYIYNYLEEKALFKTDSKKLANRACNSYFLTSSKVLQEQLEEDFTRFQSFDYFTMLKGTSNYECTKLTQETKVKTMYNERFCLGMSMPEKQALSCYDDCGYIQQRFLASKADCSVLNYSYFLNIMKMANNPYFSTRPLTIADEAHLLPDIILSHFNMVLTAFSLNKISTIIHQIKFNFSSFDKTVLAEGNSLAYLCYEFFQMKTVKLDNIVLYLENYLALLKWLSELFISNKSNAVFEQMFAKDIKKLLEEQKSLDYGEYIESLKGRSEDLFIESEFVANHVFQHNDGARSFQIFKHTVNDMSEAEMCRKHFLSKINKGVFMSATLGNVDEFAELMGMAKEDYTGFRLASNFDFSTSPINITKSGFLNYKNFEKNLPKIIADTIYIAETLHPNVKGIIHTSTFKIAESLRKELAFNKRFARFLFYQTSEEKAAAIEKIKTSKHPFVIVGPSLYEGIDLKDDMGRFNIIMKAPYQALTEYTKKKSERFPFWYERNTLEKLVQAIGRTNRHQKDFSTVYLLDNSLEKLIFKTQDFITKRLTYDQLKRR